ncbi:hypothetical protein ZOSMA_1042G00020 [Zostera marina]|uniref:Uncharacterized protein n=1 Tax=Zostera marina TaxID=29655 RepID=A0A0K9Q689_ZOSMR|nr:hypothetical protein ZOSMA_1042G00020 [Zostera marina]
MLINDKYVTGIGAVFIQDRHPWLIIVRIKLIDSRRAWITYEQ